LKKIEINAKENVPFNALEYLVGEISYGGRVTDVWDMRTLQSIFKLFFCKDFLNEEFNITSNGDYKAPPLNTNFGEMETFVKDVYII
jgi:dynein heavy chain